MTLFSPKKCCWNKISLGHIDFHNVSVVGSRLTHLLPHLLTFPLHVQWDVQRSEPDCWLCFSVVNHVTTLRIQAYILTCVEIPHNFHRIRMASHWLICLKGLNCSVASGRCCISAIVGCNVCSSTLIYFLSHRVDSEALSVRKENIGCALAWVTKTRRSESKHPFYPVGELTRICTGH